MDLVVAESLGTLTKALSLVVGLEMVTTVEEERLPTSERITMSA